MVRRVGDGVSALPGILHVRVLGTLTLNPDWESFEVKFEDHVANCRVILSPGFFFDRDKRHFSQSFCGWMFVVCDMMSAWSLAVGINGFLNFLIIT